MSDCPISSPACLDQQKLPLESTAAPAGWQTSWSCTNGIASQVTHPASITGRITGLLVAAPSALRQTGSMESSTPACFCRTGRLAQHCTQSMGQPGCPTDHLHTHPHAYPPPCLQNSCHASPARLFTMTQSTLKTCTPAKTHCSGEQIQKSGSALTGFRPHSVSFMACWQSGSSSAAEREGAALSALLSWTCTVWVSAASTLLCPSRGA